MTLTCILHLLWCSYSVIENEMMEYDICAGQLSPEAELK